MSHITYYLSHSPACFTEGSLITAGLWWKSWLFTKSLIPLNHGEWSVWLILEGSGSLGCPLGAPVKLREVPPYWLSGDGSPSSLLSLLWHHPIGCVCAGGSFGTPSYSLVRVKVCVLHLSFVGMGVSGATGFFRFCFCVFVGFFVYVFVSVVFRCSNVVDV